MSRSGAWPTSGVPQRAGTAFFVAVVALASGAASFPPSGTPVPMLAPDLTLMARDTFRIVADLDGDAAPDTFGYTEARPWHTVRFASRLGRWEARPGDGLDSLFADWNRALETDLARSEPDPVRRRERYARLRIAAENVEHGPVMAFRGRLVVLWYMEPLYPSGINTYDLEGRLLSRYIHPGHLRCMLPLALDGRDLVAFGGTNNLLDQEDAACAGRPRLNLPVVGVIPLGADGLDPALALRLSERSLQTLRVAEVSFYAVVDSTRNSQVVQLWAGDWPCLEVAYEPGSTQSGGYARAAGRASVDVGRLARRGPEIGKRCCGLDAVCVPARGARAGSY